MDLELGHCSESYSFFGWQEPKGVQDNVDPHDQRFGPINFVNSEKRGLAAAVHDWLHIEPTN